MITSQAYNPNGLLDAETIRTKLAQGLGNRFNGQKVLVLIPDHTRSLPLPDLFRRLVELLVDARQLDFMVALGTHPPLSEEALNNLVGITAEERAGRYKRIGLLNHAWDDSTMLASLGSMGQNEIKQIAGPNWHSSLPDEVDIRINKLALEYDHILIGNAKCRGRDEQNKGKGQRQDQAGKTCHFFSLK